MKKHDLQPTDDNIRNTFIRDSIGRNKDLVNVIKIIDSIDESFSIALDSYWGSGKTFFVKQVKMILDTVTKESYGEIEGENQILSTWRSLSSQMQLKKYVSIYYDAWANDCDDDPIYSLVYQMILDAKGNRRIKNKIKDKISFSDVLSVAGKITGAVAGIDPNDIASALKKGNFIDSLSERKDINKRIEELIAKLLPKGCDRLLIIIDELDRCNPEFAVKLLERIKHYFNNDKVTFVFAVNIEELQHTIKKCYGQGFNAKRYLDRFFDLTIKLPKPDMDKYYGSNNIINSTIKATVEHLDIQMRELPKYTRLCNIIEGVNVKKESDKNCNTYDVTEDWYVAPHMNEVILNIVIPYLLGLIITNEDSYNVFFSGNGAEEFIDFLLKGNEDVRDYIEAMFVENKPVKGVLQELYDHIIHDYSNQANNADYKKGKYFHRIGKVICTANEREYIIKIIDRLLQNMEDEE